MVALQAKEKKKEKKKKRAQEIQLIQSQIAGGGETACKGAEDQRMSRECYSATFQDRLPTERSILIAVPLLPKVELGRFLERCL